MVLSSDLRQQPTSDNPYISGLLGDLSFRQGYVITAVLQAKAGDSGLYGGTNWQTSGAKDAFIQAAAAWEAIANVKINVLADNYQGTGDRSAYTWVEELRVLDGLLGEHDYPYAGDLGGAYNFEDPAFTAASNRKGGYSFVTFLHEIGHGLGLSHPFEGPVVFPGVTDPSSAGANRLNTLATTVMSYNDYVGEYHPTSDDYGWVATPMAFDIAAIQLIYGANMTTRTGNDVYLLPSQTGVGTFWACIWDAGGTDTISAANGTTGATIDLRPATLLNEEGGGGWMSHIGTTFNGVHGGFTIAHGVTIENAIGSAYSDKITGNDAANHLSGGGGDDEIRGGGGNDTILGGSGASRLYGEEGDDRIEGGSGAEYLKGGLGNDVLLGGEGNDELYGDEGDDDLSGGAGDDYLYGGKGLDRMAGGAGDDTYFVEKGDTVIELANEGVDIVYAYTDYTMPANVENLRLIVGVTWANGNDLDNEIWIDQFSPALIHGGLGKDTIHGSGYDDTLYGDGGNDVIYGMSGWDTIYGGAGNDKLSGGGWQDKIYGGDGDDLIYGGGTLFGAGSNPDPNAATSLFDIDYATEDEADILWGEAGNDTIVLEGGFLGGIVSARLPNSQTWIEISYSTHAQVDGGDGIDTVRVGCRLEFLGSFTSIERIIFDPPGAFDPQYYKVAPSVLILQSDQASQLLPNTVLGGTGGMELNLGHMATFNALGWTFETGSNVDIRITGGAASNQITGTIGADWINGGGGNDTLTGGRGDDTLIGGSGQDTAVFSGNRANYRVTFEGNGVRVSDQRALTNDGSDFLQGIEKLQFADGAVYLPDFASNTDFQLLASNGFAGEIGGSGKVFGTAAFQDVTVLDQPGSIDLDGSFNRGGDIVRLAGDASDWTVMVSGTAAIFSDGDTFVRMPGGPAGLAITFDDGVRVLQIDTDVPVLKIGGQTITGSAAQVSAPSDGSALPAGADPGATADLLLGKGASITAGGNFSIFGTTGSEDVHLLSGKATLDGSFNKGGDVVTLDLPASAFVASVNGSAVILDSAALDIAIPVGKAGMVLEFGGGDERTLVIDTDLNTILIGSQQIGIEPVALPPFA